MVKELGAWTAQCIHLGDDVYTFEKPMWDSRLRRLTQIVADLAGAPLDKVRIADLGCLEGHYGLELALHGAEVVGIEGREVNFKKAMFVKEHLSIPNIKFYCDDVRNFNEQNYGRFDVVLCLGLLYHLDAPEVMELVQRIYNVCNRIAVFDTHFALDGEESYVWREKAYSGRYIQEHENDSTREQMLASVWLSIDNRRSFYPTRSSLFNLFQHVGFTSAFECLNPFEYHDPTWPVPSTVLKPQVWKDRNTFVAIKGHSQKILSAPISERLPAIDRPETVDYIPVTPGSPILTSKMDYIPVTPRTTSDPRKKTPGWRRLIPRPVKRVLRKIF